MADAVQELRREIHKRGYDTRKDNKGHWQVFDAEGVIVRTKKGTPVSLPGTPSDTRSLNNTVAQLRSAGVLPRPTAPKERQLTTQLKRERLEVYSATLRSELLHFMGEHDLEQTDVWHYAWYYNTQHPPLLLSSEASAQTMVSRFLKGRGLGNKSYTFLTAAFSAMKTLGDDVPRAPQIRTLLTTSEPATPPKPIEVEGESPKRPEALPKLAFEVMQHVYREDKDHDAIMALVEEIAKLELDG